MLLLSVQWSPSQCHGQLRWMACHTLMSFWLCREDDSSDGGQRRSKHAKKELPHRRRAAEDQPAELASTDPILEADEQAKAATDAAAADALAEGVLDLEVVEAEAAELFR